MLSSKCDMCDNKKLRVIKYQEASGLIKNLRLRTSLIKILLLLSDCLIFTRNSMPIVLLLQMEGGWLNQNRVWEEGEGVGTILQFLLMFLLFFVCLFVFHLYFYPFFSHLLCPFVLSDQSMIAVVSVSLFFISFLSLWSL